jgi:hypothetical protein
MLRRQLLCHDRAYCGDGDVCSGHILGVDCKCMLQLQRWLLSSVERPVKLHSMPRRQLLCDDRASCGDGGVCSGKVLRVDCERLHQLQRWLLSRQRRAVVLHDLFIGSCFHCFSSHPAPFRWFQRITFAGVGSVVVPRLIARSAHTYVPTLFELPCCISSPAIVFLFAFLLLSTPLTRLGHLLGCERHPLHELFSFLLPSVERPVELHGMSCWQLLCHDRAYCGDGNVCRRQILGVDCKCMLQLQRRLLSRHRRTIIMLDLCSGACYLLCIRTIICRLILSRQELGRLIRKVRPYVIYT